MGLFPASQSCSSEHGPKQEIVLDKHMLFVSVLIKGNVALCLVISSECHKASSVRVIAQVIKSLMILLLGWGLPALAVTHFGFCSGSSDACRHSTALTLSPYILSRGHLRAYLDFSAFTHSWTSERSSLFFWQGELVDRPWTEQRNTVKCAS